MAAPGTGGLQATALERTAASSLRPATTALTAAAGSSRGVFGAVAAKKPNPQIHTHDKYKQEYPQPTYDWMNGRFVLDRNGAIWHRSANYRHHRYVKTASQLTRLKRWKPLHGAYARKFIKIGFTNKYWAEPNPEDVPGVLRPGQRPTRQVRRSAVPDLRPDLGDPALRQSYRPPGRQTLR